VKQYIASSIKYIVKKRKEEKRREIQEKIANSYRVEKLNGNNQNKRGSFKFSEIKW